MIYSIYKKLSTKSKKEDYNLKTLLYWIFVDSPMKV